MVMDAYQTYHGDHSAVYTDIESLHCIPETNVICQLYLNEKENNKV